jgi:hypothetical protein
MSEVSARSGWVTTGLLTAAGAAFAGALVGASTEIGVAVVLGLLMLVFAARMDPKRLAVLGLIGVLLARSIEIGSGWAPTAYTDEVVTAYITVVLVTRRLLDGKPLRRPPGIWMFAAFVLFGVFSSIVSGVPLSIAAAGGILVVKGILLYFALAQVDWTTGDIPWLARVGAWVLGVTLVCALINLVAPVPWTAVLSVTGHYQFLSVLPSLIGPFTHPLQFGNFMSMAAIACAAPLFYWAQAKSRARGAGLLFLGSALGAVLSFRRTAIVGLLAALSYLALKRRSASFLLVAVLALPVAAILLFPLAQQVWTTTYDSFVVNAAGNARTRLTVDSASLAVQHFPFGVGFGRFGSATAREHYSVEYLRLGYDNVYGLGSPENPHNHGHFLTDTQWPAILGETGILGALFFLAGLWFMFRMFGRASRAAELSLRLVGVVGLGWTVHVLLESVAYPVFVTSPTSPLMFGLAGITAVLLRESPPEPAAPGEPPVAVAGGTVEPSGALLPAGADARVALLGRPVPPARPPGSAAPGDQPRR